MLTISIIPLFFSPCPYPIEIIEILCKWFDILAVCSICHCNHNVTMMFFADFIQLFSQAFEPDYYSKVLRHPNISDSFHLLPLPEQTYSIPKGKKESHRIFFCFSELISSLILLLYQCHDPHDSINNCSKDHSSKSYKFPESTLICRKISNHLSRLSIHGKCIFFSFPGRI